MSAAVSSSVIARFPERVWSHPLLASLDARARAELESAGGLKSFRADEKLFSIGEPADALFVVVSGEVSLRAGGRSAELRRLSSGEAVGEEAAASANATRRHDATAVTACELAAIPSALLRRVIARGEATDGGRRTRRWLLRALATDALERADFSRDVPTRAREMMLDAGRAIELRRGEVLHREGDESGDGYFVAEGVIQISTNAEGATRSVLAYHKAGDFFGDEALDGEPRDGTATATSDAWIYAVRGEVLREISATHPAALARAIRVQTAGRARQREIRDHATRHVLDDFHRFETSRSLLAIDQETCIRCGHCAWSCASSHDDGVSRLLRRGDVVVAKMRGESRTFLLPSSCQHCKNPACMVDCPTGAITRDAHGEVHIREELCTGCGSCAKACPWDNIQMAPRIASDKRRLPLVRTDSPSVAVKCDLCHDRGEPACVDACPVDAIIRVDPSVEFDDVRAVLGREKSGVAIAARRSPVPSAIIAASMLAAFGAFLLLDGAPVTSGVTLLALVALLLAYALVKRFAWRAKRRVTRALVAARPHFIAHVALGSLCIGVGAAHAHGHSALAIAFFGAAALGALAAITTRVIPRRLARIERAAVLPEEITGELRDLDARAFRDLSGKSDLLKGLYERVLRPYSRSWLVLASTCLRGTPQRAQRERLGARVRAIVGEEDERLAGLDGLVASVVARQALRAQRILTATLRVTSFAHVVLATSLALLVVLHVIAQVRAR